MTENELFSQEINDRELDEVAGGKFKGSWASGTGEKCVDAGSARIRAKHGCAATVENGSSCWNNDACKSNACVYDDHGSNCGATNF
ncbi:MAG: hypothetical protein Q4E12_06680 [Coriobacteriia bacterium]|nr:hypothetical protein [Coriobacteriia bacterium]